MDGRIEPGEWDGAGPPIRLTQQDPNPGEAPSEDTEIWVARDGENIYFAIRCHDKEPRKVVASTMARDGDVEDDDFVCLLLDTFLDRRSGYVFEINPAGAKRDGLAKGEEADYSWDGIWEGRASRDARRVGGRVPHPDQDHRLQAGSSRPGVSTCSGWSAASGRWTAGPAPDWTPTS